MVVQVAAILAGARALLAHRAASYEAVRRSGPPSEWAAICARMGDALFNLGALTNDATVLRQSLVAYRDSLEEISLEMNSKSGRPSRTSYAWFRIISTFFPRARNR